MQHLEQHIVLQYPDVHIDFVLDEKIRRWKPIVQSSFV